MNDTPLDVEARLAQLLAHRTGSERVAMMFSMIATAKAIVTSSIRAAQPEIGDAALRAALFERIYAGDFTRDELAVISARIRGAKAETRRS